MWFNFIVDPMLIKPANITSPRTKAFFTTRTAAGSHDDLRVFLTGEFNISKDNIYMPVQKHTDKIHMLERDNDPVVADAVITNNKNVFIGVVVADCVPVLLYDCTKGVIGAVHAGWKGTAREILKKTIRSMCEKYNSLPEDIKVAIGPSIRGCSYEVGEEVVKEVQGATGTGDYYRKNGGKFYLDLSSANKLQALSEGVAENNIWQSVDCTFCNPLRYYSYRYSGGTKGRQGGFIGMW
jgi:YfiH family protein